MFYEVGYPVCDDAGLARSRAREDQQRAFDHLYGFALLGVKILHVN
jgi:hypothetical protein